MVLMALCLYLFIFHLTITRSCRIQELVFQKDWCFLWKRVNFLNPKDVMSSTLNFLHYFQNIYYFSLYVKRLYSIIETKYATAISVLAKLKCTVTVLPTYPCSYPLCFPRSNRLALFIQLWMDIDSQFMPLWTVKPYYKPTVNISFTSKFCKAPSWVG